MKKFFILKTFISGFLSLSLFSSVALAETKMKIKTPAADAKKLTFCFSKYEPGPVVNFVNDKMIKIIYGDTKADLKVLSKKTRTSTPEVGIKVDIVEYKVLDLAEKVKWLMKISSYKQDKQLFITIFGEQRFFGSLSGCSSLTRIDE